MPLNRCQADGKPGWKWGDAGKCYPYAAGDAASEKNARKKAMAQAAAMGEFPGTGRTGMIDLAEIPTELERRLSTGEIGSLMVAVENRRFEARAFRPELRRDSRGNPVLEGYGTVYDFAYDVLGGPPDGFSEVFEPGAAKRSVENRDDVRLLVNHQGAPLARTRSRTLELESDDKGLFVRATLDPANYQVQSLMSAMERGDMDEMSIGFRVLDQSWDDKYTERRIREVKLYDVSVVTFPANPATVAQLQPAGGVAEAASSFSRLDELKSWRAQVS